MNNKNMGFQMSMEELDMIKALGMPTSKPAATPKPTGVKPKPLVQAKPVV